MSIDTLIQKDLINFRHSILERFKEQHPHMYSILDHMLSGRKNMVGLQVYEGGNVVGTYTLMMDGVNVVEAKSGILDSALHHPLLGVVKPYVEIERNAIEAMIKDDQFKTEIFTSIAKYLPDITIKFLR
ncbi:MAG: hypothetical protein K0R78_2404 [Pelosinus sp.]|jgi:hypothetical protein|nr:hypothetical protein [Pelosinus sp.]